MTKTADDTFSNLIEDHKRILYKVAHAYCQDATDRQDVIQEIIIQLWQSFDRYDHRYRQSTWVYRIALNVAISFYRRERRRKEASTSLTDGILKVINAEEPNDQDENIQLLHRFIATHFSLTAPTVSAAILTVFFMLILISNIQQNESTTLPRWW